jgi:hypothetical protein
MAAAAATPPDAGTEGNDVPEAPGGPGFTSFLAASASFVLALTYQVKIKRDMTDLGCVNHISAEIADWVLFGISLLSAATLGICWFDKSTGSHNAKGSIFFVILMGTSIAVTKLFALAFFHGVWCTMFEMLWVVNFGMTALTCHIELLVAQSIPKPRGVSRAKAEAAVAAVMGKFRRNKIGDAELGAELETGMGHAQCAICLGDWEQEENVVFTPCQHAFHEECLQVWLVRQMRSLNQQSCAVCRQDLKQCDRPMAEIVAPTGPPTSLAVEGVQEIPVTTIGAPAAVEHG